MEDKNIVFRTRLLIILNETNTSNELLAKEIGITRQTVFRYLSGETEPRCEMLYKIAKYLKVSSDFLLGLSDCEINDYSSHISYLNKEYSKLENAVETFKIKLKNN